MKTDGTAPRSIALLVLLAAVSGANLARADMGSVWVGGIGPTSVTLVWSDPSVPHRLATEVGTYRVSWKHVGSPYSLYPQERIVTGNRRTEVRGLDLDTEYEFRVETYAEKVIAGKWMNAKHREVGIVRQSTGRDYVLRLAGSTRTTLRVEFTNNSGRIFDRVRFAYKTRGNLNVDLNATAARKYGPEECWQGPDGQPNKNSRLGRRDRQPFEGQKIIALSVIRGIQTALGRRSRWRGPVDEKPEEQTDTVRDVEDPAVVDICRFLAREGTPRQEEGSANGSSTVGSSTTRDGMGRVLRDGGGPPLWKALRIMLKFPDAALLQELRVREYASPYWTSETWSRSPPSSELAPPDSCSDPSAAPPCSASLGSASGSTSPPSPSSPSPSSPSTTGPASFAACLAARRSAFCSLRFRRACSL